MGFFSAALRHIETLLPGGGSSSSGNIPILRDTSAPFITYTTSAPFARDVTTTATLIDKTSTATLIDKTTTGTLLDVSYI